MWPPWERRAKEQFRSSMISIVSAHRLTDSRSRRFSQPGGGPDWRLCPRTDEDGKQGKRIGSCRWVARVSRLQTRFAIWRIWQLLTVRMQTWIRGVVDARALLGFERVRVEGCGRVCVCVSSRSGRWKCKWKQPWKQGQLYCYDSQAEWVAVDHDELATSILRNAPRLRLARRRRRMTGVTGTATRRRRWWAVTGSGHRTGWRTVIGTKVRNDGGWDWLGVDTG